MHTLHNYVAKVERAAKRVSDKFKESAHEGYGQMQVFLTGIRDAQHFVLPDGGVIFDDGLKGLEGMDVRLPFPVITVSFLSDGHKVLLMAYEQFRDDAVQICVLVAVEIKTDGAWSFMPGVATMVNGTISDGGFDAGVFDKTGYLSDSKANRATVAIGIRPILELCEALSCSNVRHEPVEKINPAVNARRVRAGKSPIYETRRLVINAGQPTVEGHGAVGAHSSPRQHLRRGHIRRLPTANIWVNSCVVGRSENGVVNKDYSVRNGKLNTHNER